MKRKLLIALGCVAGIIGVRVLVAAPEWYKQRRDNRQFIAVNNLTPDRLIAPYRASWRGKAMRKRR